MLPALAFGYCVKGIDNPHYRNREIRQAYLRCLEYLHGRGIREGTTFPDGQNGVFGMIPNQETFADGVPIHLRARKSAFFVDDLIVLLGSGISGGDGKHPVETTLFQSRVENPDAFPLSPSALADAAGNAYHVLDTASLKLWKGRQHSLAEDGVRPTEGD
jgi:hypothetical protein